MKPLQNRLAVLEERVRSHHVTVMIIGLGSVGTYLLDYLVSMKDEDLKIVVVGRDFDKMEKNVNIVRIAGLIRGLNRSRILIEAGVDLNDVAAVRDAIRKHRPDFIVNSSRAYAGLKYGSISWSNVRAYGIWSPLSIRFTRNIMEACDQAQTDAIVINTSYSDAVIPWLKSAGKAYPDFGSGNLNHLVPRIQYAAAEIAGIQDFWNIRVDFAAGHFHDVCISKEGHTEGVRLPLRVSYQGEVLKLDQDEIFRRCKIAMPVDQQRNMMNASSNARIISALLSVIRTGETQLLFSPGVFGELGGYPVLIGYRNGAPDAWIDDSVFSYEEMNRANRASMALDGIEDVSNGTLIYTDALLEKAKKAFGAALPKQVHFDEIDQTAQFIIDEIITPQLSK